MRRSRKGWTTPAAGCLTISDTKTGKPLEARLCGFTEFLDVVCYSSSLKLSMSRLSCSTLIILPGKTVLSSTIVLDLLEDAPSSTFYFYFDFNDSRKQYLDNLVRSIISQLMSTHQSIPEPLISLFESCQNGKKQPQSKDLETLFQALVERRDRSFLVFDALDECEDRPELLNFIERLVDWKSERLNVIVTSRKLKDLDDVLSFSLAHRSRLSIQNKQVDEDIRYFVRAKLRNDRLFKRWHKHPDVQDEIEAKIAEQADGM